MNRSESRTSKAPIPCWCCGKRLSIAAVLKSGIILTREEAQGGPSRLVLCPSCLRENLCEETRKGRWFASPHTRVSLLEILFSPIPGAMTEEVLQAVSWYRENEERRRLFFLADGDGRYQGMGRSFLRKLWPWGRSPEREAAPSAARGGTDPRGGSGPRRPETGKRAAEGEARSRRNGGGARREGGARPNGSSSRRPGGAGENGSRRPAAITPQEILGVPPGASQDEIRRAFHRLAVQYHPDKVFHLGEEFQTMAHVKFQELLRAYEAIKGRE